ncbi:hypothetical protein [Actinomadura sp. NPDC048394]|uniref:hypothetical protein n=1 Tax=Actinomadura sp. NPDC048394 TaxID=3158223 RepID=UPI0033F85E87
MDGPGLAAIAAGSIATYAGVKGISIPSALQSIVQGKNPAELPQAYAIGSPTTAAPAGGSSTGGGGSVVQGGSAQDTLQKTAATFGWGSGEQWQALSQIETHEAGWNPKAKNPSSGALGLAQALGHGNSRTAGTLGNEYGGEGLSDAQAKAANSGDAGAQALWMCNYIKGRYGDPVKAWAFWQAHNWY